MAAKAVPWSNGRYDLAAVPALVRLPGRMCLRHPAVAPFSPLTDGLVDALTAWGRMPR